MEGLGLFAVVANGTESMPVALSGVRMIAQVNAVGQRVLVEQVFVNREGRPIEAVYSFPLPEGAAVCGFEVITGDYVLTGTLEELAKGIEQYDKAVSEGHGAFMAELWRPDVFSTRVGNIKPGQAVLIRLTYVAGVEITDRKLRLSFPTTLAPRYGTATGMDPAEAVTEADALNPPHVLSVPYGLELTVHLDLGLKIKSLASPSHGLRVEAGEGTAWKATLDGGRGVMNKNVILEAELAKAAGASAVVEPGVEAHETFAAVTFLPEFAEAELDGPGPREVVFLLDCSGSMEGPSIDQAKRALGLCLRCLNEGDRFNICRFGSTFELMQPESVAYSQASLDAAVAYVGRISANLGGTELYAPLETLLKTAHPTLLREILLLTDGQVTNEPALIKLVAAHRGRARIFSFGIGPASSEFLVKGVARGSGGASDFIAPGERIEDKVLRMFARIASPRLEAVELDWHGADADPEPRQVSALFDGEPLRVAARFGGRLPSEVTLRATFEGRRKEWSVPVGSAAVAPGGIPGPRASTPALPGAGLPPQSFIPQLWARSRIAALELADTPDAVARRKNIVTLSTRYGVLSRETTFLAIEHRSLEERTQGLPAQRRIPVMLAEGWGGVGAGDSAFGMPAMMYSMGPPPAQAPAAGGGPFPAAAAPPRGTAAGGAAGGFFDKVMKKIMPAPQSGQSRRSASLTHSANEAADAAPPRDIDLVHALLLRQSAEGWFTWDEVLDANNVNGKPWNIAALRQELEPCLASLAEPVKSRVLATALTLRALRDVFADREDQWRLASQKALRWIAKHAPVAKAWLDGQAATP
jgi:Ca-activated chloride channel family protein